MMRKGRMDKSYRIKMENRLNSNTLTVEYVISCIAKYESKINELAYKEKQYRNCSYCNNYKLDLDKMISYRQPFIDFLMKDYHMTLDDIKDSISKVKEKNIPTKNVCDQIRDIIVSGTYLIE